MRVSLYALAILSASVGLVDSTSRADEATDEKPKHTIKEIMKKAHKDGLMKRLSVGKGTKDEAKELLELYESLGKNDPPKGEPGSWKEKTAQLVAAAQDVVDDKPDAGARLTKAANCAECHKMHKGK